MDRCVIDFTEANFVYQRMATMNKELTYLVVLLLQIFMTLIWYSKIILLGIYVTQIKVRSFSLELSQEADLSLM